MKNNLSKSGTNQILYSIVLICAMIIKIYCLILYLNKVFIVYMVVASTWYFTVLFNFSKTLD